MKFDLAPLEELEKLLPALGSAVERRTLGKKLNFACSRLNETDRSLTHASQFPPALPLLMGQLDGAVRDSLAKRVRQIWSLGNKASQAQTPDELDELARDLPGLNEWVKEIERYLLEAWKRRVVFEFEPATKLGGVLKGIADTPDMREVADLMTSTGAKGQQCASRLPLTEEQRQAFETIQRERDEAYSLLAASGAEVDVVDFLQAVAEDCATLVHLSPRVSQWLRDKGAEERFRVGLR